LGGHLRINPPEKGYVTRADITNMSTGFWIPDSELRLGQGPSGNPEHYYRKWANHRTVKCLKYVDEPEPVEVIPRETLVRVSLAGGPWATTLRCVS
jgi:hypothetical protein